MHMLLTILPSAEFVSFSYQINFPGVGVAGLIEIKANSASQLELELG